MYRNDPLTGDLRLVAPGRAQRLGADEHGCPFCAGHEEATPSETGRLAPREGEPATVAAGWSARSFPNLYPLTAPHEVLVPTPRHVTSWRALTLPELRGALGLLLQRRSALLAPGRYVHTFANDGVRAGASISHTHAQLVVLDETERTRRLAWGTRRGSPGGCSLCALLDGDMVVERGLHHALVAHPVPRLGGALLLVPTTHELEPDTAHLAELAALLHRALQAVVEGDLNLWLVADEERAAHWYLEIQPRTANLAGVELALGMNVSAADPQASAVRLRERLAQSH
ncbi:MAG: galT [Thermoleophilia bacterium]|nr:galT [Thermoleophilia bacterium]